MTFKDAFCARLGCSHEDYERRAFRACLYRHALPLALLLKRVKPDFFREDLELLREISAVKELGVLKVELDRFYGRNVRDRSRLRRVLLVRVSARRVLKLKNRLFGEHPR